ncbi:MAG: CHAT domain-containing tetratricopeptide repeat protein [Vicinamibacterales bacterium]
MRNQRRTGALVLLLAGLVGGCGQPTPDAAGLMDRATAALRASRLDEALQLAREGRAAAEDRGDAAWADRFRLEEAEVLLFQRDAAAAAPLVAAPISATGPEAAELAARRRYLDGLRLMATGDPTGAIAAYEAAAGDARAVAGAAGAPNGAGTGAEGVALDADAARASALVRVGRAAEAEALLGTVVAEARRLGDHHREAVALLNLGYSRLASNRFDEALTFFEPILAFGDLAATSVYAVALNNAGICHSRLGEFDEALALQQRAVTFHEGRGVATYLVQALGELGNTYVLMGQPAESLPFLRRALDTARAAKLQRDAALWAGNLATANIVLGRWDDAARSNAEAITLKEDLGLPTLAYNVQNRARIAAGRGAVDEATSLFREVLAAKDLDPFLAWEAHAGLGSTLFAAGRTREATAEFDAALDIIGRTRADLVRTEQRLSFAASRRHFFEDYVNALVGLGMDAEALEVADASRAQALAERQGVAPAGRRSAAAFRDVARRGRTTLVSYWLGRDRAMAWIVTPAGVRRVDLPDADGITHLADRYRTEVERSLANPLALGSSSGDALTEAVLAPVIPHLPPGLPVAIVADGALHGVNFEMLPVGSPRHYWIEDRTIEMAPSLGLLVPAPSSSSGRGAPAGDRRVLLVGAPAPPGDLPPLAHADAELDAVRTALAGRDVTVLRDAGATPAAYRAADPGRFDLIHFAAHATVSPSSPLDSAIELSGEAGGYKLYARDVAGQPLRADLVTISACRSAAARAYASEGLVGFAWAFLRAGARRVVAGLWDVDDRSTSDLMAGFYTGLGRGESPAAALRAAKLSLIARGGNFAKPYYWAPFQLFTSSLPPAR